MTSPYPIFTYWEGDGAALGAFCADWLMAGHDVKIFGPGDVRSLLAKSQGPARLALFDRIRIAACRSDLARLVLLFTYGGLYIDAHTGSGDPTKLTLLFAKLARKELVLIDHAAEHTGEGDVYVQNAAMAARAFSPLLQQILDKSFENLEKHELREARASDYVTYNIFAMTGGWNILTVLFDLNKPYRLNSSVADRVHLESLHMGETGLPFYWYRHYHYRKPGQHWSERQQVEPLFLPR